MPDAAREDLCRSVPFDIVRAADDDTSDGLTLEGYGAVFDTPTRIDSWEGTFDEQIARGAFRKSLRERTPRLQFDHGYHPLIGSIPIGRINEIGEDDRGLHLVARLSDNWLVEPVRDAIRDGAVDGMSFRFTVVRDEWRDEEGKVVKPEELAHILWGGNVSRGVLTRTLKEVKVSEVGPVVWPAYEETSVGVRSKVTIDLGAIDSSAAERRKLDYVAGLARRVMLGDSPDVPQRDAAPPSAGHSAERDDAPPVPGHPSAEAPVVTEPNPALADLTAMRSRLARIKEQAS